MGRGHLLTPQLHLKQTQGTQTLCPHSPGWTSPAPSFPGFSPPFAARFLPHRGSPTGGTPAPSRSEVGAIPNPLASKKPRSASSFPAAAPQPLKTPCVPAAPLFGALPAPIYGQVQLQPPGLGKSRRNKPLSESPSPLTYPPCPSPSRPQAWAPATRACREGYPDTCRAASLECERRGRCLHSLQTR